MTLESIMNFERGQKVKINPDMVSKKVTRTGKVMCVYANQIANSNGVTEYKRTGEIEVWWYGNEKPKIENYKHLKII
jgi:hypothetical protein